MPSIGLKTDVTCCDQRHFNIEHEFRLHLPPFGRIGFSEEWMYGFFYLKFILFSCHAGFSYFADALATEHCASLSFMLA